MQVSVLPGSTRVDITDRDCEPCSIRFTTRRAYIAHCKSQVHCRKIGRVAPLHKCPTCHQGFTRRDIFKRHYQERHQGIRRGEAAAFSLSFTQLELPISEELMEPSDAFYDKIWHRIRNQMRSPEGCCKLHDLAKEFITIRALAIQCTKPGVGDAGQLQQERASILDRLQSPGVQYNRAVAIIRNITKLERCHSQCRYEDLYQEEVYLLCEEYVRFGAVRLTSMKTMASELIYFMFKKFPQVLLDGTQMTLAAGLLQRVHSDTYEALCFGIGQNVSLSLPDCVCNCRPQEYSPGRYSVALSGLDYWPRGFSALLTISYSSDADGHVYPTQELYSMLFGMHLGENSSILNLITSGRVSDMTTFEYEEWQSFERDPHFSLPD